MKKYVAWAVNPDKDSDCLINCGTFDTIEQCEQELAARGLVVAEIETMYADDENTMNTQYMTITGFAWIPSDEDGLVDKVAVGESGKIDRMIETLNYYAVTAIRCEFSISITD